MQRKVLAWIISLLSILTILSGCSREDDSAISLIAQNEQLQFHADANADTPWKISAGVIDFEGNESILLLAESEITLDFQGTISELKYAVRIHPWVSENSDGAGFCVKVLNKKNNTIVSEVQVNVDNGAELLESSIAINADEESEYKLFITGNMGNTDTAMCDWLLFEKLEVVGEFEAISPLPAAQVPAEEYLIAANYFLGGWPKNMWDYEPVDAKKDFRRMAEDGFNTVVLLIPWRQFQPEIMPVSYNEEAFDRLRVLMETASSLNMNVILRIGYFHDFYGNGSMADLSERFDNVMIPGMYRDALVEYAQTVYNVASVYDSYQGAFICWEDFWEPVNILKSTDDPEIQLEWAKKLGFQDYVADHFSTDEWNELSGQMVADYEQILVPNADHPAFRLFYDAYDDALNNLLYDLQEVVPNLSMEVRLDADLITLEDGTQAYYSHDATYTCGSSDFVATVYGIPMGCVNQGERLSAEEAMEKTEYILSNLNTKLQGKPVFVEQFLFYDDTAKFSYNAQLKLDQVAPYLQNVHNILRQNTSGIGIWTYNNYLFSAVYNSAFDEGLQGWDKTRISTLEDTGSDAYVVLADGASITQTIPFDRTNFATDVPVLVRFSIENPAQATVSVSAFGQTKDIPVNGEGVYQAEFSLVPSDAISLTIATDSTVEIDDIMLYNQEQNGLLYDVYGNEMDNMKDMRILIENLLNYDAQNAA